MTRRTWTVQDPRWADQAACRDQDPRIWDTHTTRLDLAREACWACRVRVDCLADAMTWEGARRSRIPADIRGALTPDERTSYRISGRIPKAAVPPWDRVEKRHRHRLADVTDEEIRAHLEAGRTITEAADRLGFHRSTLRTRIAADPILRALAKANAGVVVAERNRQRTKKPA